MDKKLIDPQVQETLAELGLEGIDWQRRITAGDVLYLIDHCPFLQIVNTGASLSDSLTPLQLVNAKSGWKIHHYHHALSSSPGELMFFGGDFKIRTKEDKKDDGGEGGIVNPGKGTIINQAVMTAFEMVELARQLEWKGIKVVDGHPLMAWAAWMQSLDAGIALEGYEPTAQDIIKRNRIKRSPEETLQAARRFSR